MKKLVIFDLDGTLLDTIKDLGTATNAALEKNGLPVHNIESYPLMVGNGVRKLIERALPQDYKNDDVIDRILADFKEYYNEHNTDFTVPYDGIIDLMRDLNDMGVAIAVASNKYQDAVTKIIGHYFSEFSIIEAAGQRTGVPVKPDPSIVFSILLKAEIAKDDVLYVGDSGVDMETAWRACVDSVGVTWGFRTEQELRTNRATFIVHKPMQITDIVRGENLERYYNKRS